MLGSGGLCVHSGLGALCSPRSAGTTDYRPSSHWCLEGCACILDGGALRFVLRVPACTIDYIYTQFVLASEKLRMRSGRGVRSLFGGVLCCVLRVPIRTMDYSAYVSVWRAVHVFWEGCA